MTMRKVMMGVLAFVWFTVAATGVAWCGDNGNGTVTVNGLVWLKEAECLAMLNWDSAMSAAGSLANGQCGLTDGSRAGTWRLPTKEELHAIHASKSQFKGVLTDDFWSSSSYEGVSALAWYVRMSTGGVTFGPKIGQLHVWPVRSIQ